MDQTRPKVLLTFKGMPSCSLAILKEKCDVEILPDGKTLLDCIQGKDAIGITADFKIDKTLLENADMLKVISSYSAGYEHLDLKEIQERGIKVGYIPDAAGAPTAELTLALTLATMRRMFEANQEILNGGWKKPFNGSVAWMCGSTLIGATVGIVGMGKIGLAVAKRLVPCEVSKILYTGRKGPKPEAVLVSAEYRTLDQLLKESDVVIITCLLNETTRNLFGPTQFAMMKRSAVLINTSRGGVVDQDALVDALKNGQIAAAGLDVMTPEPLPPDHELIKMKNCVLLPHIGVFTVQAQIMMTEMLARNIINGLEGTAMPARLC